MPAAQFSSSARVGSEKTGVFYKSHHICLAKPDKEPSWRGGGEELVSKVALAHQVPKKETEREREKAVWNHFAADNDNAHILLIPI